MQIGQRQNNITLCKEQYQRSVLHGSMALDRKSFAYVPAEDSFMVIAALQNHTSRWWWQSPAFPPAF